jgi:predicted transcriptional regulator YdeE
MEIIGSKELIIMGISTTTTNDHGQSSKDLGNLWASFTEQALHEQLKTTENSVFCVYSDYENKDPKNIGRYRATIGYAVPLDISLPKGLSKVSIPTGNYREFTAESKSHEAILAVWQKIWSLDTKELPRRFSADVEVYGENGAKVFIGLI